ncbi:MAG: hypothetical protein KKC99_05660, partial [Proteobacteria bacterium]|nr:hypothetical protein [Pseudomonadota bacterium]
MIGYDPDAIVRHYFSDQEGELFLVSRDDFFVKSVRSVFQKTLGIKEIEVEQHRNLQSGLRSILDRTRNGVAVMVMVERYLEKVSSADFVRALSGAAPSAKIMCLTDEAERGVSAFMHELGAGSILTKPASANDIIAKTAGLV